MILNVKYGSQHCFSQFCFLIAIIFFSDLATFDYLYLRKKTKVDIFEKLKLKFGATSAYFFKAFLYRTVFF